MKLKLSITCDNSAFHNVNGNELSRIFERLSINLKDQEWHAGDIINLRDINGNKVGEAKFIK